MNDFPSKGLSICFIAPSTSLAPSDEPELDRSVRLLTEAFETSRVELSPHLFSSDQAIDHVTATAAERAEVFKAAVRNFDLIVSVAGGTGAEDLVLMIDRHDLKAIRKRRPLLVGFSDFTFLLCEIFARTRVPGVLFPALSLGRGHTRRILALLSGRPVSFRGSGWLTPPPPGPVTGIPIGGNLTTFVNFLNREKPPRLYWRDHILFIEDLGIDIEDLHRLLAALRRHRVFARVRAMVVGSLCADITTPEGREFQAGALKFLTAFLTEPLKARRNNGNPLPILVAEDFGHRCGPRQPAIPIGGTAVVSPDGLLRLQLPGTNLNAFLRKKRAADKTGEADAAAALPVPAAPGAPAK